MLRTSTKKKNYRVLYWTLLITRGIFNAPVYGISQVDSINVCFRLFINM